MAIFTFNDIPALSDLWLQFTLWRTDFYALVDSLATADEPVREKIFRTVSKRTAARLKTAMEKAGDLSPEAGEKARRKVIQTIKELNDLWRGGGPLDGFTFPNLSNKNPSWEMKSNKVADYIEAACADEHGQLYINTPHSKDELRNALKTFANRRDDLARIRSVHIAPGLLPTLFEFLEAGNVEVLSVRCNDHAPDWPLLETLIGLKKLDIYDAGSIPETVGNLHSLEHLSVRCGEDIEVVLPENIGDLKNLAYLDISAKIKRLPESLANLPSLTELELMEWCNDLSVLSGSVGALKNLERLQINGSGSFGSIDWIGNLRSLTRLTLINCGIKTLPDSIGNLEKLSDLGIWDSSLEQLPESMGNLISLTGLTLTGKDDFRESRGNEILKALPDGIGNLENLQYLCICDFHSLERIPESVGNLRNLTELAVSRLPSLTQLPESMGNLQSLKSLSLSDNKNLKALPDGIGDLKNLEHLNVPDSVLLDRLPDGIGNAASLKSLNLSGTGIRSIPRSVTPPKDFTGSEPLAIIPREASVSHRGFVNHYFKMIETLIRLSEIARGNEMLEWMTELELELNSLVDLTDVLADLDSSFIKYGLQKLMNSAKIETFRQAMGLKIEREHDHYRKKLMEIATEGVVGILERYETPQLVVLLNSMVDIKDNPIDAAFKKYRAGDRDAFFAIDFAAAIVPEGEREEISFVKRAVRMSELTRREGCFALESHLAADAEEHDLFEYGLSLLVDPDFQNSGDKYVAAVLGKMVERETDPVQRNIAAAKREAILSIHAGENTRVLIMKLLAYFDKDIAKAIEDELLRD